MSEVTAQCHEPIRFDGLAFFPHEHLIENEKDKRCIALARQETIILKCIIEAGSVGVRKDKLYLEIYSNRQNPPDPKIIIVLVSKLRKKLRYLKIGGGGHILTLRGFGYRFSEVAQRIAQRGFQVHRVGIIYDLEKIRKELRARKKR